MGSVPLKLKDSADFQNFSSTEENYLAYQVGLSLADMDSSSPAALSLYGTDSSSYSVGFLTNTAYDSAVGTGGDGSFLTFSTTTTTLRQTTGTVTIADSDYRLPILQRDSDGQRVIREMNDSDTNSLLDRLNSRIFTSDYVGSYRMGSSAPSGDYSLVLNDVMTDTRSDGHSLQYNIYQRTNQTSPTQVLPFSIKRANGDSGDYQGLQLMTPRQIKYSLGLKSKNRIASDSDGIGAYRVYSSATGTPTDVGLSGTWAAKGTATDTRQEIVDANYTRGRVSTYSRLRQSAFSADYTRTRSSAYSQNYTRTRTSTYSADYTSLRSSNYSLGFIGNYIGNYTRNSTRDSQRTRSSVFDYVGNYVGDFTGNYSRLLSFTGNYTGTVSVTDTATGSQYHTSGSANSTQNRSTPVFATVNGVSTQVGSVNYQMGGRNLRTVRNISVTSISPYTLSNGSVSPTSYNAGEPTTWYASATVQYNQDVDYTRNSTRISTYTRNSTVDFLGNYTRTLNYLGNYTGDFLGEYSADYTRTRPDDFSRNFIGNYAGEFTRNRASTFTRTRASTYIGNYIGDFTGDYLGNFTGNYVGSGTFFATSGNATWQSINNGLDRLQTSAAAGSSYEVSFTTASGDSWVVRSEAGVSGFVGGTTVRNNGSHTIVLSSTKNGTSTPLPSGTVVNVFWGQGQPYSPSGTGYLQTTTTGSGTGNRDALSASLTGNFPLGGTQAGCFITVSMSNSTDFTRASTRTSLRTSTSDFTRTTSQNFVGDYSRNFVGNYSRNFTRTRSSNFLGGETFSRDFLGNFIGNYSRDFTLNFEGNYSRNFAGNYQGNYSRNFIGDYARTFTGNYAGNTIGSGNTNIQTYTLYVRIA